MRTLSDVKIDRASGDVPVPLDVVTVHHDARNTVETRSLHARLRAMHPDGLNLIAVSNQVVNRGFASACNLGAAYGSSPIVGFLSPDVTVHGPFVADVVRCFDSDPSVVIAGNRWGKPARELRHWGLDEWVCGAAMFVRRSWWASVGGFDTAYVWSWEETDLCRQAQESGHRIVDLNLPIEHPVVGENTDYKATNFALGRSVYRQKWQEPTA